MKAAAALAVVLLTVGTAQSPAGAAEGPDLAAVPEVERPAAAAYLRAVALASGEYIDIFGELVPNALDLYDWQRMAQCESGGNWAIVDKSRRFYGGVQLAIRGANLWSVFDQIEAARSILHVQGPRAWPVCHRVIGWR